MSEILSEILCEIPFFLSEKLMSEKFNVRNLWVRIFSKLMYVMELIWIMKSYRKRSLKHTVNYHIRKARSLSLQGDFIDVQNTQVKDSHSIWYNWKVMDELVKFTLKARLNILPVNFITNIGNCEK